MKRRALFGWFIASFGFWVIGGSLLAQYAVQAAFEIPPWLAERIAWGLQRLYPGYVPEATDIEAVTELLLVIGAYGAAACVVALVSVAAWRCIARPHFASSPDAAVEP